MYSLPAVLFAAIETGTWSGAELCSWADEAISHLDSPTIWLIDLSLSADLESAGRVLREARFELPPEMAELLVGLLYSQYRRGVLGGDDLERRVADIVDAYQAAVFDVEYWTSQMAVQTPTSDELRRLLNRLADKAEEALGRLFDIALLGEEPLFQQRQG